MVATETVSLSHRQPGQATNQPANKYQRVRDGLANLRNLDPKELRLQWEQVYGAAPPPRAGRELMVLALGWELQAKAYSGLNRQTRDTLSHLITNLRAGRELTSGATRQNNKLVAGVTLVREWHGTAHQVLVLENGFGWNGKVWRSLSQIAREITGARWNGPAFFGLRSKKQVNRGSDA